jgi:hypothetical protein
MEEVVLDISLITNDAVVFGILIGLLLLIFRFGQTPLNLMRILIMPRSLVFLVLLLPFCLNAQIFNGAERQISTNPVQYAFSGFNLRYGELKDRYRLGVDLTYRPSYCGGCWFNGRVHGLFGDYQFRNFANPNYSGLTFGLFFDRFGKDNKRFFSAQPYFRYWWFNKKRLGFDNVEGYNFRGLRSEQQIVVGLRLMYGESYRLWLGSKTKGAIELSIGPGLFHQQTFFFTHVGFIGNNYRVDFQEKSEGILIPVVHVQANFTLSLLKPHQ